MDFPERPRSSTGGRVRRRRRGRATSGAELGAALDPGTESVSEPEPSREPHPGFYDALAEHVSEEAPPEPPKGARKRRGVRPNETVMRILWAIPAIVLAVTVIVAGGEIFAAAMIVFAWIGMSEFFRMVARAKPFDLVGYAAAAGMIAAAFYGNSFHMVLAGVAFFPVMLGFAARRRSLRNVTFSMAVTVFAVIWIAIPFAHAVLLRNLPDHGAALLVNVLVATFFTDTFAYAGGRMFGRHPLTPTISPNKTIEGLAIGVLGGIAGFWFAGLYQDWLSGVDALLMGACIAVLAPIGDLFESAIKRDLDVKDSGRVFGPHGGLLDRLDAVLFTVVAGYYLSLAVVY